jgi:hypothetical protein
MEATPGGKRAQRGNPVDGGQQLTGILPAGPGGPLAGPLVGIAKAIQPAIALPGVRDDPRARLDVTGHEGMQRGSGRAALSISHTST